MKYYLKIKVGKHIWLVPVSMASQEFKEAVRRFNDTEDGEVVHWTDDEYEAFSKVNEWPGTWKPF